MAPIHKASRKAFGIIWVKLTRMDIHQKNGHNLFNFVTSLCQKCPLYKGQSYSLWLFLACTVRKCGQKGQKVHRCAPKRRFKKYIFETKLSSVGLIRYVKVFN